MNDQGEQRTKTPRNSYLKHEKHCAVLNAASLPSECNCSPTVHRIPHGPVAGIPVSDAEFAALCEESYFTLGNHRVRATGNRVVVQKDRPQTMTAGGLHIPETSIARVKEGTILAVGPDVKERDALRVGRRVNFNAYAGATDLTRQRDQDRSINPPQPHAEIDSISSIKEDDIFFVYE